MKLILGFLILLVMMASPSWSQEDQSSNDIIVQMTTDLNLQNDQVTNITPIIQKYTIAFADLKKSIQDGTINPSAIDSQRQQLKAAEAQELSQYLTANQINQWSYIQNQQQEKDNGESDDKPDPDQYSNMPKNNEPKN